MNQNQLCWIKLDDEWIKGDILGKKEDKLIVKVNNDLIEQDIYKNDILFRNTDKEDNCNNLIELIHLNEPSILNNIYLRYLEDNIYTFNGNILIAVNPFKNLDIYQSNIKEYSEKNFNDLLPHPFYIGKQSLENIKSGKNQTILVSGESGAGKTQTTKYLMNYITTISDKTINGLENKILASNPILEAFGNAKTIRNDNSSRFGKFIKLQFDQQILSGAEIKTYLLEKIRITKLSENERNFHIFYMLIRGLSDEMKEKFYLKNIEEFNYLNCSNINSRCDGVKDEDMFKELQESFDLLNFNQEDVNNVFKTVSAILHLGNIRNIDDLCDDEHLLIYCELMNFPIDKVINIFQFRYILVNGESIQIENTQSEFIVIRDSLSQLIYCLLFEYLVNKINKSIKSESENFIGILDIFGFEVFKNNGFEQLCINYTNEKLQSIFNKFIFKLEQEEYIKEQIEWKDISYPDNLDIVNLYENKRGGLFGLLQEQCILKTGNDKDFYQFLVKNLHDKPNFQVTSKNKPFRRFQIEHYAGKVTYQVDDFIYKNRNQIESRFQELIINGSDFLKQFDLSIFSNDNKSLKTKSLIYQFRNSLNQLLNIISSTRQHYIRCIKPNDDNTANNFNKQRVLEQLKYCGVLEAIKIARAGYPIRIKKQMFIEHFYTFMNNANIHLHTDNISSFIESASRVEKNDYQLGTTKVFLKKHIYDELILRNKLLVNTKAIVLQRNILSWHYSKRWNKIKNIKKFIKIYKKYYLKKINSSNKIISIYRAYKCQKYFKNIIAKITTTQSIVRMRRDFKKFKKLTNCIRIQSWFRTQLCQSKFNKLKEKHNYAKKIQNSFKKYKNRQNIKVSLKKLLDINNRCALLEKMLEEERQARENERLERENLEKNNISNSKTINNDTYSTVTNNQQQILDEQKFTISEQEKILFEKNALIDKLLSENSQLKEKQVENSIPIRENIPQQTSSTENIDETTYVNYEIANKMENLYLQLSQAQEELAKMKKQKVPKNRGFFDVVKGWFK